MRPQILLTFANPSESEPGFLRSLRRERGEIEAELWAARRANVCGVDVQTDVTRAGLIDHLQTAKAAEYAVVFHYGGHASGSALALGKGTASADGVAAMLAALPRLHLVFLNGCSTQAQVDGLLELGIPAVIATDADVVDAAATDFAIHFYRRLGEGRPLGEAFDEAVAAVRTVHDVLTMDRRPPSGSSRRRKKTRAKPTVPWKLYPRAPGEAAAPQATDPRASGPHAWSLPLAAEDPLFVLPKPAFALPAEPFRGGEPYRPDDWAVFQGRGAEIRAAYDTLTRRASSVVVLRGVAGVGRTSLINAGLLPRLAMARSAQAVVPETLDAALAAAPEVLLIDEAERLTGAQIGAALKAAPRVLFATRDAEADRIVARVAEAGRVPIVQTLAHLDEPAILRVIKETSRLAGFRYSSDLPQRLATDLVGRGATTVITPDGVRGRAPALGELALGGGYEARVPEAPTATPRPEGATTPIVSATLTALWRARTADTISSKQYEKFKGDGCLDAYVRDGLAQLAARDARWVEAGFAIDVLAHHMTLLGTADKHTRAALKARYAHRDDVDAFVEAACVARLLVRTQEGSALAHDLLAPLINSRFATSRAPAQQARRIVEERLPSWRDGADGVPLDAADLAAVNGGRASMPVLDADGLRLIAASEAAVQARARRTRAARMALITAAVVIVTLAFVWQKQRSKAKIAASQAEVAETKRAAAEAEAEHLVRARTLSAGLIEAFRKLEDRTPKRAAAGVRQLASLVHANPTLAPDVAHLALRAWSGVVTDLDDAALRLARPTVVARADGSTLVDQRGHFHALESVPTGWFVLPGERWVGSSMGPLRR